MKKKPGFDVWVRRIERSPDLMLAVFKLVVMTAVVILTVKALLCDMEE